jgi:hypothetical protein
LALSRDCATSDVKNIEQRHTKLLKFFETRLFTFNCGEHLANIAINKAKR